MTASYLFLALAVLLGVTSNSFAKSAEGFTLLFPSIITGITIVIRVIILGKRIVKPSAFFAKLFEVTPRRTANAKNKYEVVIFI